MVIEADDVTFDGDGHLVEGQSRSGTVGILIRGADGVTVEDVEVREWGNGIELEYKSPGTRNVRIVDSHVTDNVRTGIRGDDVGKTTIRATHVGDNGVGIHFSVSSTLAVHDTDIYDNDGRGIYLDDTSRASIEGNEIFDNGGQGIYTIDLGADVVDNEVSGNAMTGIHVDADNNARLYEISGNEAWDNGEHGIVVREIAETEVSDNEVRGNDVDGILLVDFHDGEVIDNEARKNGDDGLHVLKESTGSFGGDSNVIENNVLEENDDDGLFVEFSSENVVENNEMTGNGDDGVQFSGTEDNELVDNEVTDNDDDGARFVEANDNDVVGNTIEENDDDGLDLENSDDNDIEENSICGNGDSQIVDDATSTGNDYDDNDVASRC
ncbi:right-handed parallel beta-helix repeat-containing protein [Haloarchaeobius litoreus]|uniref:right-handed parallel beta-helix repeat-containing protein n=1 Tax=Haloarchaeobius litoreus TaxID=755306 RepID=UPI0034A59D56